VAGRQEVYPGRGSAKGVRAAPLRAVRRDAEHQAGVLLAERRPVGGHEVPLGRGARDESFRAPGEDNFGEADPYLNAGLARDFHEKFPNSELFLLPTARHFPQLDEPEEVARLILSTPLARRMGSATGTSTASEGRRT
jgi:pimeloyl-ACP methyl ester carboxylesterase